MNMEDLDTPVDEALLMGEDPQEDEDPPAGEPSDETQDEPAQEDETDEPKEAPKDERESDHIPKWRFNEINEERKQLRAELEALKSQRIEPPREEVQRPADVRSLRDQETALESQLEDALMDGDMDKRRELRAEIRKVRDQIDGAIRQEVEAKAESKLSARLEQDRFLKTAEQLASKYTVLDAEKGSPAAIEMVVELRDAYIAKGMTPTDALQAAAKKVVPLFDAPKSKDEPQGEDPRKAAAIKRGADTNNATPPKGSGVGNRAQAPREDVSSITQSKWEKLSPAEREKLLSGS